MKFYSVKPMMKQYPDAQYYMIIGERSNGKTFSCIEYALDNYFNKGEQFAYIRRWQDDIKGKRGTELFKNFINNETRGNIIKSKSKGKYNTVIYRSHMWFMAYRNEDSDEISVAFEPFAYGFTLSDMEHDKSTSYPNVTTIIFDEFITRKIYFPDEFVTFTNVLSTIIRHRNNVKIFMCGNTVNKYCPYFKEMGLTNIDKMKQNTIDVYTYGDSGLMVCVEFSEFPSKKKESDIYFAFNNPKLQMITKGTWEINVYPHLPREFSYKPKDVKLTYYIVFNNTILHCDIVHLNKCWFTFIHPKTTPIKEDNKNLVYTLDVLPYRNYRCKINKPVSRLEKFIYNQFRIGKVFYSSNDVGEIVRNYLMCNN